jgi:hypothetical protein
MKKPKTKPKTKPTTMKGFFIILVAGRMSAVVIPHQVAKEQLNVIHGLCPEKFRLRAALSKALKVWAVIADPFWTPTHLDTINETNCPFLEFKD